MRTTVIAIGLFLLVSWPLITWGDRVAMVFGMPTVFVHIMSAWCITIALFAWVLHRQRNTRKTDNERG